MVTFRESSDPGADADILFHALAHRARRHILDILRDAPGSRVCDLSEEFSMSRIAVMKHLGVLEEANLVVSKKEGRERRLYLNAAPLQQVMERWIDEYGSLFAASALELKRRVESKETTDA